MSLVEYTIVRYKNISQLYFQLKTFGTLKKVTNFIDIFQIKNCQLPKNTNNEN